MRITEFNCNCGGAKTASHQFLYTSPKGESKVYTSEVQARAAQIRNGGGTITVQAK